MKVILHASSILRQDACSPEGIQHALHDGIDRNTFGREDRLSLVLPADGGLGRCAGLADDEALVLEGEKAEELVLEEGSADREARVVVAHLLLGIGKRALGAEEFVAIEVVGGAMDLVGSTTQRQVDGAAGVAPTLRASLGLRGELIDRVERQNDAGDA